LARTHYETLGIKKAATQAEVKSAYRKLVLAHHPDHSKDPRSRDIFLAVTEAYEELSDPARRQKYDEYLESQARRAAERIRQNVTGRAQSTPPPSAPGAPRANPSAPPPPSNPLTELQRLTKLFAQGRHAEAERIARQMTLTHPRLPLPYAVLGDVARLRGDLNEAARMYAFAAQFEPNNPIYQRRYEELLSSSRIVEDRRQQTRLAAEDRKVLAPMAGGLVVLISAVTVAMATDANAFASVGFISTWTVSLLMALIFSGIAVGSCLSMGNLLDRFTSVSTTASGRAGPAAALGIVAIISFWAACVLYIALGIFQRAFNFSTTRLVLAAAATTFILSISAGVSPKEIDQVQVLLWGGNVVYASALLGWMVADSFRP